ncbi:hypothetical protein DSECCO2_161050 [anaerobic digester metagenome]
MLTEKSTAIKAAIYILVGGIAFYLLYTAISRTSEVNRIRKELNCTVDSIQGLQHRYDSLANAYLQVQERLQHVRFEVDRLRVKSDSVMQRNIQNATRARNELKKLIDSQNQSIEKLVTTNNDFRLK